jgi:hypothetical protein
VHDPPPKGSKHLQEAQNQRKRLHAQVRARARAWARVRVNPNPIPSANPSPNPNQASAEWLNPPSAELAARKVQLVSQQARALGGSNSSEPRT